MTHFFYVVTLTQNILNQAYQLVMENTCFKNPENVRSINQFQNTSIFCTGISDFHKMILNVLKT